MTRTLTLLAAAWLALVPAHAQEVPTFAQADIDASGTLTLDEVKAVLPTVEDAAIAAADADNDGVLNADEYAALTAT